GGPRDSGRGASGPARACASAASPVETVPAAGSRHDDVSAPTAGRSCACADGRIAAAAYWTWNPDTEVRRRWCSPRPSVLVGLIVDTAPSTVSGGSMSVRVSPDRRRKVEPE